MIALMYWRYRLRERNFKNVFPRHLKSMSSVEHEDNKSKCISFKIRNIIVCLLYYPCIIPLLKNKSYYISDYFGMTNHGNRYIYLEILLARYIDAYAYDASNRKPKNYTNR